MSPDFRRPYADGYVPINEPEATYILGRLPDRIYVSKSFILDLRASQDTGHPARFIYKVFDEADGEACDEEGIDMSEDVVSTTPAGRKQLKLMVARKAGHVREILLQRVAAGPDPKVETLLKLDRTASARLITLVKALDHIAVEGDERAVRVDDVLLGDLFRDPDAIAEIYRRDPQAFRSLIANDTAATDVVAIAHRRAVVDRFRELLTVRGAFEDERQRCAGSKERVWQQFFESNPWILGAATPGQLLTAWDDNRLEQVVAGFSIAGRGKRSDALLQTGGPVRSLVFAEIKHHETPLLATTEYRPGCWSASSELAGGVTQTQQTVYAAVSQIGERLAETAEDGSETGESTFLVRPRSFLVIGQLAQLKGEGGVHLPKFRSFELYRRNLYEPEIVTFDELLARAEWHIEMAEMD